MKVSSGSLTNVDFSKGFSNKSEGDKTPENLETAFSVQEAEPNKVSEKSVIEAIEKANKVTLTHNTRAEFSVHEVTKDIMVKIVDTDSNEVIREFPPKKFLDLIAKLWDLAGIVVDERR